MWDTRHGMRCATRTDAQSTATGVHGLHTVSAVSHAVVEYKSATENVTHPPPVTEDDHAQDTDSTYEYAPQIRVSQTGVGPSGHHGANATNHAVAHNNTGHVTVPTPNQPMEEKDATECLKNLNLATLSSVTAKKQLLKSNNLFTAHCTCTSETSSPQTKSQENSTKPSSRSSVLPLNPCWREVWSPMELTLSRN